MKLLLLVLMAMPVLYGCGTGSSTYQPRPSFRSISLEDYMWRSFRDGDDINRCARQVVLNKELSGSCRRFKDRPETQARIKQVEEEVAKEKIQREKLRVQRAQEEEVKINAIRARVLQEADWRYFQYGADIKRCARDVALGRDIKGDCKKFKDRPETQARIKQVKDEVAELTPSSRTVEILKSGKLTLGMNSDVVKVSWGSPRAINRTVTSATIREQWVYGSNKYLYFDDGILTAWQD